MLPCASDAEGACWEDEELDIPLAHALLGVDFSASNPGQNTADLDSMQRFEAELQPYLPVETAQRPSAMCLWDVCPALLDGTVDLPTIEDDHADLGLYTIEGWRVRDPIRSHSIAEASAWPKGLG